MIQSNVPCPGNIRQNLPKRPILYYNIRIPARAYALASGWANGLPERGELWWLDEDTGPGDGRTPDTILNHTIKACSQF